MKIQMTLLLLVTALAVTAQTKQPSTVKPNDDTLTITAPALPAAAKFGKDVYKLHKVTPGQKSYSFELAEPAVAALFQFLELSTGPHVQIEQLKNLLREQLKPQMQ